MPVPCRGASAPTVRCAHVSGSTGCGSERARDSTPLRAPRSVVWQMDDDTPYRAVEPGAELEQPFTKCISKAVERPGDNVVANVTFVDSGVSGVGDTEIIASISLDPDRTDSKETVRITRTSGITLTGDFYGLSSVTLTENENTAEDPPTPATAYTYTRDGRTQSTLSLATGDIGITFTAKGIQSVTISSTAYNGDSDSPAGPGPVSTPIT